MNASSSSWPQSLPAGWLVPGFSARAVRALMTSRVGGFSAAPWQSMNLGTHVGDDPDHVAGNRQRLAQLMGMPALYLDQVHGTTVVEGTPDQLGAPPSRADAAYTQATGLALTVQVADCLPVLMSTLPGQSPRGIGVAAAHAGWRGLCNGVIETTVRALQDATGAGPEGVEVWLGPCIGPSRFEVGDDVRDAFLGIDTAATRCFTPGGQAGRWWADLHGLARGRLAGLGLRPDRILADPACTVLDPERYFSYRRDGVTGRMVASIAILASCA